MFTRTRRLAVEALEHRDLMAGDVALHVTNGDLVATGGDNKPHNIHVTSTSDNHFHFEGIDGTTINGQSSADVTVTRGMKFVMGSKLDKIIIGDNSTDTTIHGNLVFVTGKGRDFISLVGVSAHNLTARMSLGDPNQEFFKMRRSTIAGNLTLNAETGASSYLNLSSSHVGGTLQVDFSGYVSVAYSELNNLTIRFRAADDSLGFIGANKFNGTVNVDAGAGFDQASNAAGATFDFDPNKFSSINFEAGDEPFFS